MGLCDRVIGALLATASAINANLFAVFNIMDNMGSERELPKLMNKSLWRQSTWGNIIVVVLIMLMTAALNLGSLASVASATFFDLLSGGVCGGDPPAS